MLLRLLLPQHPLRIHLVLFISGHDLSLPYLRHLRSEVFGKRGLLRISNFLSLLFSRFLSSFSFLDLLDLDSFFFLALLFLNSVSLSFRLCIRSPAERQRLFIFFLFTFRTKSCHFPLSFFSLICSSAVYRAPPLRISFP